MYGNVRLLECVSVFLRSTFDMKSNQSGLSLPFLVPFFLSPFLSEALGKMKDVYEKNPQMGDPASLASQISHTSQNIERLRRDLGKYEVMMTLYV